MINLDFASQDNRPPPPTGREEGDSSGLHTLEGKRIFLVEDEALLAVDIELAVQDQGGEIVGPAMTLHLALILAETEFFDAAIMDINLNGQDVLPVVEVLRRRAIPFLFHSAHAEYASLDNRYAGAPIYGKPMLTDILLTHVVDLLETT